MNWLYTSIPDVVESLEKAVEAHDEGKLVVADLHPAKAVALTADEMEERGLADMESVCTLEFQTSNIGGSLHLDLSFHEHAVHETFKLTPAGHSAIDADQATDPRELGYLLEKALDPLVEEYDAVFTFAGVEAGSMASGGHFTDFEFSYAIDGVRV